MELWIYGEETGKAGDREQLYTGEKRIKGGRKEVGARKLRRAA